MHNFPFEYFQILFNIAWAWLSKTHDEAEERLGVFVCFALGHRLWFKAFQVSAYAILLLGTEAVADEGFEQTNEVDRGDVAFICLLAEYARNYIRAFYELVCRDRFIA